MDANTVAKSTNLPFTCVEGIWTKATELLQKENAIVPAPGQSSEARMVATRLHAHMVTPTKAGGFSCDSNCPNWKSIGICAHSVAVAQVNGKLEEFISVVKKKKEPKCHCPRYINHAERTGQERGCVCLYSKANQPTRSLNQSCHECWYTGCF